MAPYEIKENDALPEILMVFLSLFAKWFSFARWTNDDLYKTEQTDGGIGIKCIILN